MSALINLVSRGVARRGVEALLMLSLAACSSGSGSLKLEADSLDDAFRIDIQRIDVVFDIDPEAAYVDGRSVMEFQMREGQIQPLFHFDPWTPLGRGRRNSLKRVVLDGEEIPLHELISAQMLGSDQNLFEIDRVLMAGTHRLEFEWSVWVRLEWRSLCTARCRCFGWILVGRCRATP